VHHYPTKADLVTAALMHLAAKRTETAWQELARVKESDDPIGAMLDLAWELHQGPIFAATVEFWVAARTDPQLREHVARVEPAATAGLVEFANALLGSDVDEALLRHAAYTVMDTIRGLLVTSWGLADPGDVDARWRRAKARLRAMVVATMAEVRAPTTS
jgi:AcrR family transcriptional regulator